jgi:hypothetical protein
MKIRILLFLIFFGFNNTYSQDAYELIHDAKKLIIKNKLNKALYYLNEAKKGDYGFCGNAWDEAFWAINYNKAIIYQKKKEYDKSLIELDSIEGCGFGGDCEKSDSLKVVVLINKFGKEKISKLFLEETSFIRNNTTTYFHGLYTLNFISINYIFTFSYVADKKNKSNNEERNNLEIRFNELIKRYNFYKLLI